MMVRQLAEELQFCVALPHDVQCQHALGSFVGYSGFNVQPHHWQYPADGKHIDMCRNFLSGPDGKDFVKVYCPGDQSAYPSRQTVLVSAAMQLEHIQTALMQCISHIQACSSPEHGCVVGKKSSNHMPTCMLVCCNLPGGSLACELIPTKTKHRRAVQ